MMYELTLLIEDMKGNRKIKKERLLVNDGSIDFMLPLFEESYLIKHELLFVETIEIKNIEEEETTTWLS